MNILIFKATVGVECEMLLDESISTEDIKKIETLFKETVEKAFGPNEESENIKFRTRIKIRQNKIKQK